VIFVLSRTFSGIVSLKFKKSRDNGMLKSISDNSSTEQVILILIFLLFAMEFFAFWVDIKAFVCILISALVCSIYCCSKIYNKFKGITGDLSGWYLTLNEIFMLFGLLISQKL
ncbi:MAG: adenosylcobinamide-GDP ribazoletransferase, partial [Oscillospiraceae bacterium]